MGNGMGGGTGIEYSEALTQYIGKTEIKASTANAYDCFTMARDQLAKSGLSPEDQGLARIILGRRIRETQPPNIGIASSDGGSEAD